jgi:hypothetical protein
MLAARIQPPATPAPPCISIAFIATVDCKSNRPLRRGATDPPLLCKNDPWRSVLACKLGNHRRRPAQAKRMENWTRTSLPQRWVKTGSRLARHAGYDWRLLADRAAEAPVHPTPRESGKSPGAGHRACRARAKSRMCIAAGAVFCRKGWDRAEFQSLAAERLEDAVALLKAGRHGGAYYVCGLRRRMCYYVHDIGKLLDIAVLGSEFDKEASQDAAFRAHWAVVKDWPEESRYQSRQQQQAQDLLDAVSDPQHGVLRWLRQNW